MLLATESADEFAKMRDGFFEELQPNGALERYYVESVAYHTFEIIRYRCAKAGIINAIQLSALRSILRQVLGTSDGLKGDLLARGWFDGGEAKAKVMKLLQTFGFDETTIAAEALRLRLEDIEKCDRLEGLAEARREKDLRFLGKLRKNLGERLRQRSDRILEKEEEATPLAPVDQGTD